MRSRVMRVGLLLAVGAAVLVAVLDDSRLTGALAVGAAVTAAAAAVVAARAASGLGVQLEHLQRSTRKHGRQQHRLGRELVRLTRRTQQQAERHREALRAGLRQTRARVAALEAQLTALRTELRPKPDVRPHTGVDLTTPGELAMSGLVFDGDRPHVVLLMQSLAPRFIFAGIRTALLAAAELAVQLELPLRILVFEDTGESHADTVSGVRAVLDEAGYRRPGETLRVSVEGARDDAGHHADDVWFATLWATAHAVAGLAESGRVRRDRVVYLVQDWEPSFYPWGDLHARAESTYHAGFRTLVNSLPLARYVADQTASPLDEATVFAPQVDRDALARAADLWTPGPDGVVRVFFYARPAAARNMFNLGLQSLRRWAETLPDGDRPLVRMAGAPLGSVDLGPAVDVEVLGKTSYADYYAQLSQADIGLALMNSPHPGHLALELPMAGIPTVTNRFGSYRDAWVDNLVLGWPDPGSIAGALREATELARGRTAHGAHLETRGLGGSLADAVSAVARALR